MCNFIYFNKLNLKTMITVNGKTYNGNNLVISGNNVIIDGKSVNTEDTKEINIVVNGDISSIDVDNCNFIEVNGNCEDVETTNGDVYVTETVKGDVSTTNGNVNAMSIKGKVKTVNGNVSKSFKSKKAKKSFFSTVFSNGNNSVIQTNSGVVKGDNIAGNKIVSNFGNIDNVTFD